MPWLVLDRLVERWRTIRDLRATAEVLSQLSHQREPGSEPSWRILGVERPRWVRTGVTVVAAGPHGGLPELAIKLPHTSEGTTALRRQRDVQLALHSDPRLADWRRLVPRAMAEGRVGAQPYFVESFQHGQPALSRVTDRNAWAHIQDAAAVTINGLHRPTAEKILVGAAVLDRWVDQPLRVLARINGDPDARRANAKAMRTLCRRLHDSLSGLRLHVCWIHGDYWAGNFMLAADGVTPTGIVDWDRAAERELPWHDLFHLLLYTRRYGANRGVGDIIELLKGKQLWNQDERKILARAREGLPDDGIDEDVMVLLYWLRHTAATLTLYPHYSHDREYLSANVEPVLRASLSI